MATTTGVPPAPTSRKQPTAPPESAHTRVIQILLWMATGAAATLWINVQLDGGPTVGDALVWLFAVAVLTAWPSYLCWRATQRLRTALDRLEQAQASSGRTYEDGYAAGYLSCVAERFPNEP